MNKNGEMGPCFEAALPEFCAKEMVDVFELVLCPFLSKSPNNLKGF